MRLASQISRHSSSVPSRDGSAPPKPPAPNPPASTAAALSSLKETSAQRFAGASDPVPPHAVEPQRANSFAYLHRQKPAAKPSRVATNQKFVSIFAPRAPHSADSTVPPVPLLATALTTQLPAALRAATRASICSRC